MTKIVVHVTKAITADPIWLIVQIETPIQTDDLRGNRSLCSKYKLAAWSINRVINLRFKVQKQNPFFLLLTIFVSDVDWKLFIN